MKKEVGVVDAIPSKRLFLSIISDYNINRSVCELVDNAIDNWFKNGKPNTLNIDIVFNTNQQIITVKDNSGGVHHDNLKFIVGPGQTGNEPSDVVIGLFGVGTKRAVVALSQDIKIKTRHQNEKTYQVEFDDEWFRDDEWQLPVYEVDQISEGTTEILLQRLRYMLDENVINRCKEHLQMVYALFLKNEEVIIRVNNEILEPLTFENWAYPPKYRPYEYQGKLELENGKKINVKLLGGLSKESSPVTGEFGVYFYCNNRLIAKSLKNFEVGFSRGLAGLPHPNISLVKVFVYLEGAAELMPWNSSKSGIDFNHAIFRNLREPILKILKNYASISRALEGEWSEEVFRYDRGRILKTKRVSFETTRQIHLLPVPSSRPRYHKRIKELNRDIMRKKPWTKGLVEAMAIVDVIAKKRELEQRNRVSLIVLDSTLEIGFKEFLVNESRESYSDRQLLQLFRNRMDVHDEIKTYARARRINNSDWGKIRHYYSLRCKLIHERATVDCIDDQINDFKETVEKVLNVLFRLEFNS